MRFKFLIFAMLAASLLLAACNMPGGSPSDSAGQVQTAAAETVSAQFTQNAALTPSATNTPLPTATLSASNTPAVVNTVAVATSTTSGSTAGNGCDVMSFVSDVTIPDNTDIAPGATFTKTWRLRNSGACTWTTSYSAVFSSGSAMGAVASKPLTASIAPNSTVDISIDMTAPATNGTYTGYWVLRNATGQNFGSFYVVIDVVTGGSSGGNSGNAEVFPAAAVGQVNASGTVAAAPNTGSDGGTGVQAFVSFDISSIPDAATIEEVQVNFSGFDTQGNPFASMGCLEGYAGSFFPLDASDYGASGSGPDLSYCSTSELSTVFVNDDVMDRLQAVLGSSNTLEYKLVFSGSPTGSALVRFLNGGLRLIITYSE